MQQNSNEQTQNYRSSTAFNYKIVKHIGTLSEHGNTHKELNLVSYNGAAPKLDIRTWIYGEADELKIGKGITLNAEEAEALAGFISSEKLAEIYPVETKGYSSGTYGSKPFN